MADFYGEEGCCLTCDELKKEQYTLGLDGGCLCPDCKYRQCDYYEPRECEEGGVCTIADGAKRQAWAEWREVRFLVDKVLRETPKAYLVDMGGMEMWFPKSVAKLRKDKHGMEIVMPQWLAEKKGQPPDG